MASFFTALFSALAAFPKLLEYVGKVIDAMNSAWFEHKRKQSGEQFDKGVERAKRDKNTCELEKAFNPSKKCD